MDEEEYLRQDFSQLISSFGVDRREAVKLWESVRVRYSEEHRHYHTLTHIYDLLQLADRYESEIRDYRAVRLAIYFHDVVYDPASKSNEEDSAAFLRTTLAGLLDDEALLEKVSRYILQTKTHAVGEEESDEDLKLFLDLDLSVLGADQDRYQQYMKAVRKEYAMYSDFTYAYGRFRVLQSMLDKGHTIYRSAVFQSLNQRAMDNIGWEMNLIQQDFYSNLHGACSVS